MTVSSAGSSTSNTTPPSSTSSITTTGTNTQSTIDWNALIQAAVNAKLVPAQTISAEITANQAKISAYQKLQTDLSKLASDLTALSTSDIDPNATNVFAARAATISATGSVNPSALLSMSLGNGAATGDHTLTISQMAAAQKVASATQPSP